MAAAFFNRLADPARAEAISAGTQPGERVHPVVVDTMDDVGIDLSAHKPQRLTDQLASGANLLVTMGCGDACPYVPGLTREDWPLQDPTDQPIETVRRIRDDIESRVAALISARGWSRS